MKLGKRNLFYSIVLAGCMLLFLVGYFVYMLPSLYVNYMMEQNLVSIKNQHIAYMKDGNYGNVQVKNPTACFTLKIPDEGDSIHITAKMFSAKITIKEEKTRELFTELRKILKEYSRNTNEINTDEIEEKFKDKIEECGNIFQNSFTKNPSIPFQIQISETRNFNNEFLDEYMKTHMMSDDFIIFEMGIHDEENHYVNYMAAERTEECLILTFLPAMMPDMNEIRPIVLQSLPMLGAVILLLVLLFSQVYSKSIVTPIECLVQHTEQMKNYQNFCHFSPDSKKNHRKDEIGILEITINELYQKLKASFEELEEKNLILKEENIRQEVLLRASSHQLKTPISAALLLVDGMKNKIGKYQNTDKYLPKVKEQLLSMKKMVEDILYLNHFGENPDMQERDLQNILEKQLAAYQIAITDKKLSITIEGKKHPTICTDETIFSAILENILSNAVNYTPENKQIVITLSEKEILIQNYGTRIDDEILPHIFEPFVSGSHEKKKNNMNSHGLGLYIAAYYAKKTGITINIYNKEESVVTVLRFP